MNVNGWQRIGIIASVVWILGAGAFTYNSEIDSASQMIVSDSLRCESYEPPYDAKNPQHTEDARQKVFDECNKIADNSLAIANENAWFTAAAIAIVPVPFGWGFSYLFLFLGRWVKRGFRPLGYRN